MKLYNIYKISLNSFENLKSVVIEIIPNNNSVYEIKNYKILKNELINLREIEFYTQYVSKLFESIPILVREKEKPQFDGSTRSIINNNLEQLKDKIHTVIELYESFNIDKSNIGIDVLMPKFETIDEYSECINDLRIIFKNYNLFKINDKTAEYSFNDIGSLWISFSIDPSIIKDFLIILALVIDFSIRLHHKIESL